MIHHKPIKMGAHRASWIIHNGPIPDGLWVLHKCDNPPCVNPEHLHLGTGKDNYDDMVSRGRRSPSAGGNAHKNGKHWQTRRANAAKAKQAA